MRFFSDGPSIPDSLLERRDQGRVVFLCGAGVSLNGGMPSFLELAEHVFDFFDPPNLSDLSEAFRPWKEKSEGPKVPLDQIFHLLYQEYGQDDVNALVAERLRSGESGDKESWEHQVIARISSDEEGNSQIVTTNFDHLFEQGLDEKQTKVYVPPAFPAIHLGVPLAGITYLHGRLQEPDAQQHPYVLSSADFGRAYLSEGWATNFIRSLLGSYTVVLVGYQAEDLPVKYLLQGLNHDGSSDPSKIYVFEKGRLEDIEAKWRDRGVTAIAYTDHPHLWKSLEAWADRADDPRKWRSKVVELAMRGPRQVPAHERGQVAHLVRSTPGARLFAREKQPPPAEWLCVFDASCRAAPISKGNGEDAATFDPLDVYGLDDDPPRANDPEQASHQLYDHLFEWRRGDTNPPGSHRLDRRQAEGFEDMPPRLLHLSYWITRHLNSPTAAWWAIHRNGLHPRLVRGIHLQLGQNTGLHLEGRRTWHLILEYHSDSRHFPYGPNWFELKDRINNEGWTSGVLREFQTLVAPILSFRLPSGLTKPKPPLGTWEETDLRELVEWEVKALDQHGETLDIPNQVLGEVFRLVEGGLRSSTRLLSDIKPIYFPTPTCYPGRETDGGSPRDEDNTNFQWFLELFGRVVEHNPASARAHANLWPIDDEYFFRKLRLFALNHDGLFAANETAEILLALNQDYFWDPGLQRELLFLIHDRWVEFSTANRIALADRLLNGPAKMEHWSADEYRNINNELACRYTRWLTLQGLELSRQQTKRLDKKILAVPEWSDGWASSVVMEYGIHVGWGSTDEKPDAILDLPVNQVVERVKTVEQYDIRSNTDQRPFAGLVKANPRKALAALSCEARKGAYPQELWSTLINEWPEETKPRLFNVFLNRLARLPDLAIQELRHAVGRWIEKHFLIAFQFNQELAWKTFDTLVKGLISGGENATQSGIGQIQRGEVVSQSSRRTFGHAINGPIGEVTQGLTSALNSLKLDKSHGIPDEFKTRLEILLTAPGEGSDHAVMILTRDIGWLDYLDPEWVSIRIMPWFDFDHPAAEPAWNGYLSASKIHSEKIGTELKPLLLELFPKIYQWKWDRDLSRIAAQITVEIAVFQNGHPAGLSPNEARLCLRNMNDQNRQDAVYQLGEIGQRQEDGWDVHVIPFVNKVWPRERAFRTSNLVSSWVSMLEDTGDDFPAVLRAVRRFLVPVIGKSHWLYSFSKDVDPQRSLTAKYPEAVIELLDAIIPNSAEAIPSELAQILDLIEETSPNLVRSRRFLRLIGLVEQT